MPKPNQLKNCLMRITNRLIFKLISMAIKQKYKSLENCRETELKLYATRYVPFNFEHSVRTEKSSCKMAEVGR